jgi:hypothetical protein
VDVGFPFASETASSLFLKNEKGTGGFFPVGTNHFWHGGVHLSSEKPVLATADGTLIAYRLNKEPLKCLVDGKASTYSTSFVLLRHELKGPDGLVLSFYSLYMHLLPANGYTADNIHTAAAFIPKKYTTLQVMAVHEEPNQKSKAPRSLAKGATIQWKDPVNLKVGYNELAEGGYVYFQPKKYTNVLLDVPDEDSIVSPPTPVQIIRGDIIGHCGPYMAANNVLHFEIFTDSTDFMTNPKKITRGPKTLKIAKGTIFKIQEPDYDRVAVQLTPGSSVKVIRNEPGSKVIHIESMNVVGWVAQGDLVWDKNKGKFKLGKDLSSIFANEPHSTPDEPKIAVNAKKEEFVSYLVKSKSGKYGKIAVTMNEKRSGWTLRTDLAARKSGAYVVKNAITELASQDPAHAFKFEKTAGQNSHDMLVSESAARTAFVKTLKGETWYEMEFEPAQKGWIKSDDPKITVLSEYDWPGWLRLDEPDKYSKKGLCDVPSLLSLVNGKSTEKEGKAKVADLKTALQDAKLAKQVRALACLHSTEWNAKSDKASEKWAPLKGDPWKMTDEAHKKQLATIETLQWWEKVDGKKLPSDAAKVWHVHPVGFIEQTRRLTIPLTEDDKKKIIYIVAEIESNTRFNACNEDGEFKGRFKKIDVPYDGVLHIGLSWGLISFTQDSGSLGKVLNLLKEKDEKTFAAAFGSNWKGLLEMVQGESEWVKKTMLENNDHYVGGYYLEGKQKWDSLYKAGIPQNTDLIEIRGARVWPVAITVEEDGTSGEKQDLWEGTWLERFKSSQNVYRQAGKEQEFKDAQLEIAIDMYLNPALRKCKKLNIRSARGIAMAFDRTVQGWPKKLQTLWEREPIQTTEEEMKFLEKMRDSAGGDPYRRLSSIYSNSELNEISYEVESYLP